MKRWALLLVFGVVVFAGTAHARADGPAGAASAATKQAKKKQAKRAAACRKLKRKARTSKVARRAYRRRCVKKRKPAAKKPGTQAPAAPQGDGPGSPGAPATPTPAPTEDPYGPTVPDLPPSNPRALQVISGEFFLNLSKPEVLAGDVRVEFNNAYAEDPHDLKLMRGTEVHGFDELAAGEVEAKTFDLNAGTWRLFCALDGHAERGMSANLRVSAG